MMKKLKKNYKKKTRRQLISCGKPQQNLCPCLSEYLLIHRMWNEEPLNYQQHALAKILSSLEFLLFCLVWKLFLSLYCSNCRLRWKSRWNDTLKRWFYSTCWNLVAYTCSLVMSLIHFSEPPTFLMSLCTGNFISPYIISVISYNEFIFYPYMRAMTCWDHWLQLPAKFKVWAIPLHL